MSLWDAGVDLGATLAKAVAVPADRPLEAFETFVAPAGDDRLLDAFLLRHSLRLLAATGGGAAGLADRLAPARSVEVVDEFASWAAGEPLLAGRAGLTLQSPHLLVSLGTGTSILRMGPDGAVARVGGTALGGGTLRGLGRLLLGTDDHDRLVALAATGDRRHVDLLVGDLYRPGGIALMPDLTAANFGKAHEPRAADVAHALLGLVGENVALLAGQIAVALATAVDGGTPRWRPDVLYAGSTLRNNPLLVEILGNVTSLVGAQASFLPLGEFTGALGALARVRPEG
jgi:type II pantothenate kinase